MPRSFLIKTKQQQQRCDVTTDDVIVGRHVADQDVSSASRRLSLQPVPSSALYDAQPQLNRVTAGVARDSSNGSRRSEHRDALTTVDSWRFNNNNYRPTPPTAVACNTTLPDGPAAATRLHLDDIMTSSSSSVMSAYVEAVAWLRQLHAMCAAAALAPPPFPLPLPSMTSPPEPPYYVTKMASAMQPSFDPRWTKCPSPRVVELPPPVPPSRGRSRDFSIPSILSRGGPSSTGTDSDCTTEPDELSQSTSPPTPFDDDDYDDVTAGHVTSSSSQSRVTSSEGHHVQKRSRVEPLSHQVRRQQQFECPQCSKVYSTMGALKMHVRTHTLPCRCPLCGKAFSRPWLLQGHLRTHTGERPFQCTHCDRAFADRSNLRAHQQTHAGVKRYRCQRCNKPFSRQSLLAKHHDTGSCHGN